MQRGAGFQGLEEEGLVSETEIMRACERGGERVASYSKKFCADFKNFKVTGNDCCQVRPSVEIQNTGVVFKIAGRRNSCLKNPSSEAATQTSAGAVAGEFFDWELLLDAAAIGAVGGAVGAEATDEALAETPALVATELLESAAALTKPRTGMRKARKLVPEALTVR